MTCPLTFNLNGLSSQKSAICFCSSVKLSPIFFTSMSDLKKTPFLFFISYAGGRGGINCEQESIARQRILFHLGSMACAYIGGVGTHRPSSSLTVNFSALLVSA